MVGPRDTDFYVMHKKEGSLAAALSVDGMYLRYSDYSLYSKSATSVADVVDTWK